MTLQELLCCPRCKEPLRTEGKDRFCCSSHFCALSRSTFPLASGQPVLIDFETSMFSSGDYLDGRGASPPRDDTGRGFAVRLRAFIWGGKNKVAPRVALDLAERLEWLSPPARLLVIGGGAIGSGMERLYESSIEIIGTDIYASPNTAFVADAHSIPLRDECVDAVWIQAVLEHVLEPTVVADEIHRVLKSGGYIYADTPFMQQVHEGAFDFTRFTLSGHRWLFRHFDEIETGPVGGAGTALAQTIRYTFRALGVGDKVATLCTAPFFWLRFLDPIMARRQNADAASGVYFFGQKTGGGINSKDMARFYEAQVNEPAPILSKVRALAR